jgi:CBS domain-containing protein
MSGAVRPGPLATVRRLLADRRVSVAVRSVGYLLIFGGFLWALQGAIVQGLWLVLMGWLLTRAARSSYNAGRLTWLLEGLVARDALEADPAGIAPSVTLEALIAEDERESGGSGVYAVRQAGELIGVIDVLDADAIPRTDWPSTQITAVMKPLAELEQLPPDLPLLDVVARFERTRREAFPVTDPADGGRFLGFVTRERVHQLMRSRKAQSDIDRSRARARRGRP